MKVNVKWGKEVFNDVEIDLDQPPLVFKSQLFALSGVPPDRQKVLIKGGQLKDEEWGKQQPKEGMTIMMMGSAEKLKVEAPANAPKFVEDLPEHEQSTLETKAYGSGLKNLGNTCYMNSTVQCLYSVDGLRQALTQYRPAAIAEPTGKLVTATQELFQDLQKGGEPFPPFKFLLSLRQRFPQFAQQTNEGLYMQQDAEECFTQLMTSLKDQLKDADGKPVVDKLFGVKLHLKLKCDQTGEEKEVDLPLDYKLKCNISIDVNYLHQGITLGLAESRDMSSEQLGTTVTFKGSAQLVQLPPYLTVQMVRFFYRADVQQKAKILRKVTFPLELDVYDYCTSDLQKQLAGPRAAYKDYQDKLAQVGRYELTGVLTHKGRSADSGHYVAWIKQADGSWVLFDDDELHIKTAEDVLALNGGGDWHMAYLLVYKAVTLPEQAVTAAVAWQGEAGEAPQAADAPVA
eukprot:gene2882-3173_t